MREAARAALGEQSQRALAREIGISAAGLRYLLSARETPYRKTLVKLRAWYVRQGYALTEAAAAAAPSAVNLLVELLPPDAQPAARRGVLESLRQACRDAGHPLPEGVAEAFAGGRKETAAHP